MVRHPLAKKFLQSGLFKGLGSFRQLERRIEKLEASSIGATNLLRGNAFEVFAAAYLAMQRSQMVRRIWPKMQLVPPTIARQLLPLSYLVRDSAGSKYLAVHLPILQCLLSGTYYDARREIHIRQAVNYV